MADTPPIRIQRKRTAGWRMPKGARSVTRPGPFGNPFRVGDPIIILAVDHEYSTVTTPDLAVALYRAWLTNPTDPRAIILTEHLPELTGLDLACYCQPDDPCHADVLLELANP
ncbi:MAG TPA: DUF4326 domain-containing protein [Acidimicrobiales bacterium]|nr:DUF4326 domain-containing protein [Acidimicrobiales bacterium]